MARNKVGDDRTKEMIQKQISKSQRSSPSSFLNKTPETHSKDLEVSPEEFEVSPDASPKSNLDRRMEVTRKVHASVHSKFVNNNPIRKKPKPEDAEIIRKEKDEPMSYSDYISTAAKELYDVIEQTFTQPQIKTPQIENETPPNTENPMKSRLSNFANKSTQIKFNNNTEGKTLNSQYNSYKFHCSRSLHALGEIKNTQSIKDDERKIQREVLNKALKYLGNEATESNVNQFLKCLAEEKNSFSNTTPETKKLFQLSGIEIEKSVDQHQQTQPKP